MDWQQATAFAIVFVTAFLLARQQLARRRRMRERLCGGDCSCSPKTGDLVRHGVDEPQP